MMLRLNRRFEIKKLQAPIASICFWVKLCKLDDINNAHGKNDFVEESKILLDTDLKIILLAHQNNFVGTLKITSNATFWYSSKF